MFWAPCGSVGGGLGGWGWGVFGGAPYTCAHARVCTHAHACVCTHAHARTCMRGKHDNSMQRAAPIGFGEIPGIPYDVIHACTCVHVHACAHVWGGPCHHPHPHPPTHPPPRVGDPRNQSKFNST